MTQLIDTANEAEALTLRIEPASGNASLPLAVDADYSAEDLGPIYRFDRRCEDRTRTSGWAQILCSNPYCTFLGGSKELVDFSQDGLGVLSECEIPVGEIVEVRVAPFRVRGKLGVISRCELIAENEADEPKAADGKARRLYKVGISFQRACNAA